MSGQVRPGGGAVQGGLAACDPAQAAAVLYLRLWSAGPEAQALVWNDFATGLGPAEGRRALAAFERFYGLIVRHGLRPAMLHDVGCPCLGSDEACLAALLGQAPAAADIARGLVAADQVAAVVEAAGAVGPALGRLTARGAFVRGATRPVRLH